MTPATIGFVMNRPHGECTIHRIHSRGPRVPSVRAGRARSARVMGAPRTRKTGLSIVSVMWPTMCALNRTRPYTAGDPEVAHSSTARPASHATVRSTGQRSPRRRSCHTERRYQRVRNAMIATHSQSNRHIVIHRAPSRAGGSS